MYFNFITVNRTRSQNNYLQATFIIIPHNRFRWKSNKVKHCNLGQSKCNHFVQIGRMVLDDTKQLIFDKRWSLIPDKPHIRVKYAYIFADTDWIVL